MNLRMIGRIRNDQPARASRRHPLATRTSELATAGDFREALEDDAAFEAWYRRTMPRVFSYLMSRTGRDQDVAEELVQQTYIAAIEQRWRFEGRADSVTWLVGIARHKLADHYRAVERADRRHLRMAVREIHVGSSPPRALDIEDREAIAEAFRSLPPAQRAMLAFVAQDGLSVADAARLLGKSASAGQSLLHRARTAFRDAYGVGVSDD